MNCGLGWAGLVWFGSTQLGRVLVAGAGAGLDLESDDDVQVPEY